MLLRHPISYDRRRTDWAGKKEEENGGGCVKEKGLVLLYLSVFPSFSGDFEVCGFWASPEPRRIGGLSSSSPT